MRLRSRTDDGQSKELEKEKAATLLLLVGWDKLIIYVSIFSSKRAFYNIAPSRTKYLHYSINKPLFLLCSRQKIKFIYNH
jgi:hypothetical protein